MKSLYVLSFKFLAVIFLLVTPPAMGQENFSIAAGLGGPELLNLGIRHQMGQSQLGLSVGIAPGSDDKDFSVGADYFYHFLESSSLSTRRLWYGRVGLYYYTFEDEYQDTKLLLLVPRIGRDFNLSPKVGIAADIGLSLVVSRNRERYEESFWWFDDKWENEVYPSLGFSIFYRL